MESILFIVAIVFSFIMCRIFFVYGLISSSIKGERKKYLKDLAIAKDQYGNAIGKYIFNHCLIKDDGYKFGNPDETISSVIGKNKAAGTLNRSGKLVDGLLNKFEKDHSIKSIDETEGD